MAHIHEIKDAEAHFIINATSREISNAGELPALTQGDHNSEQFTFVVPRFADGHDLMTCNKVKVHYVNIDSISRKTYYDIYKVEDMRIDEADSTKVVFTWLISKYATQYAGLLNFAIHFTCETDGVIDYAWKTAAFTGIVVKSSVDSTEQIMTEYTDILEKWKQEMFEQIFEQIGGGSGHTHDNKDVLDYFGFNYNRSRPTFGGSSQSYALALIDDVTMRVGSLRQDLEGQIALIPKFSISVVDTLPTTNINYSGIYLLKDGETEGNLYTEYVYIKGKWEKLGSHTADVPTTEELVDAVIEALPKYEGEVSEV